MQQTISIIISGKVQGVFFRQSTKEQANRAGIGGEVRNTADGKVAIIATGTQVQLDELITWCRQGPPRAKVTGVDVTNLPLQSFDEFRIIRS